MLSVTEAAKILNVTTVTVRLYIKRGLLPGAKKIRGTQWQIPRAAIDFFDSVNVAGTFAKKERKPFCKVEEYNFTDGEGTTRLTEWNVEADGVILTRGATKKAAEMLVEIYNEAAEKWAGNA